MRSSEPIPQDLPEEARDTLRSYLNDVIRLFGAALEAVILYGSAVRGEYLHSRSNLNLLLLLTKHDADLLRRYAKTHRRWASEKIVVPLLLTEDDLLASQELFPLECLEIKECHVLLTGRDPFPTLQIDTSRLAVECEREMAGNLIRLQQRVVEGGGKAEAQAILLPLSLTALLPSLRGLYRTLGHVVPGSTGGMLADLRPRFGIDSSVFQEVWQLKHGLITPGSLEMPRLFERYVTALRTLVERVGQLRKAHQP
jgi:hypothetical protein